MTTGIITWIISVAFPTLATYKALKTNDLALLRPWLMYWVIVCLASSAESLFSPLLYYVPLYSLLRCGIAVWLVSQGAVQLWQQNVEPFIASHEPDLDQLMAGFWTKLNGKVQDDLQEPEGIFSKFRMPISSDNVLDALAKSWNAAPASGEQLNKQRSYLQAMLNSLDKDADDYVAVDLPLVNTKKKGWLW